MNKDNLIKFINAIEADPGHAAFLLGLRHNAALQYHAVNVRAIGSMSDDAYLTDVPKLYPREFAEVQRIADQCVALAEAMDKDPNTLQAVELFQSVANLAKIAQPQEQAEQVEEAAGMQVKCPKCGNEFAVKAPAPGKAEEKKPAEKAE
jgi:hypothetical protein